ncbi:uncharacterized protein PG986_010162 [Apiospora aurea]|uniref:Uncharacterized protein n=1 Tax=Apiospora aurea TaxID=335848 RepID=A0ABR1Q9R2_9PEZI
MSGRGEDLDELVYHDNWMTMVELYGIRELSYETDRLPALSGLATLFKRALPLDTYLAGLWERDIHRQLFWNTSGTSRGSLADLVSSLGYGGDGRYIVPSWSWLCKQDLISFGYDKFNMDEYADYRSEYSYLRSSITPDGLGPTGKLRDASLLIRSRFMPIPYTTTKGRKSPRWRFMNAHIGYVADCELDWVEEASRDETDSERKGREEADSRRREGDENRGAKIMNGKRGPALLLLGSCAEPGEDGRPSGMNERYARGMVICAAPEIDPAACVRVGTFYSDPEDGGGLKLFEKCQQGEFLLK